MLDLLVSLNFSLPKISNENNFELLTFCVEGKILPVSLTPLSDFTVTNDAGGRSKSPSNLLSWFDFNLW